MVFVRMGSGEGVSGLSGAHHPALGWQSVVGVASFVAAMWVLSGLDATGKWLMAAGVSLVFLCWVRYCVHLVLVIAWVLPRRGMNVLHSRCWHWQLLRGMAMLCATLSFFTAMRYLPQSEATAINFLAPMLVLVSAPWLLQETFRPSRLVAAVVAFAGVLLIIRPGSGLDSVGVAFALLTALSMAVQHMATRKVAIDDVFTTLICGGLVGSVATTLALPWVWTQAMALVAQFTTWQWMLLLSTGVTGAMGHLLQIAAYRRASASLLSPFAYLQIISSTALGWWLWQDFPQALSWVGIALVCASGMGIAGWEWRLQAKRRRMPCTQR